MAFPAVRLRCAKWDDFYEAAKKIRAVDSYITSDSGDAGFFDSMTWLAGATPDRKSTRLNSSHRL